LQPNYQGVQNSCDNGLNVCDHEIFSCSLYC